MGSCMRGWHLVLGFGSHFAIDRWTHKLFELVNSFLQRAEAETAEENKGTSQRSEPDGVEHLVVPFKYAICYVCATSRKWCFPWKSVLRVHSTGQIDGNGYAPWAIGSPFAFGRQ